MITHEKRRALLTEEKEKHVRPGNLNNGQCGDGKEKS